VQRLLGPPSHLLRMPDTVGRSLPRGGVSIGGSVAVYLQGSRGPGRGHGYLQRAVSDCPVWQPQLDALANEFTVVVWDAPGCGQSEDPPESFRLAEYANVLAGFITALGLSPAHVLGSLVRRCARARAGSAPAGSRGQARCRGRVCRPGGVAAGVNLTAFDTRLSSTCESRARSASSFGSTAVSSVSSMFLCAHRAVTSSIARGSPSSTTALAFDDPPVGEERIGDRGSVGVVREF